MSAEIEPALYPSEWARILAGEPVFAPGSLEGRVVRDIEGLGERTRHAVIAALLYDQPFGFTRKMLVDLIDLLSVVDPDDIEPLVESGHEIVACIRALLPPEEG